MASDTLTKEGHFWRPVHGPGLPSHPESESTSRQYAVPALLFCALFALWFAVSGRQSLDAYREQVNRLDMRRRHGIPDTDNRPFSVAHRDVCVQKAKEESQRVLVEDERQRQEQTQNHNKENFWPGATEVRGVLHGVPRTRPDAAGFSPHVHFITPTRSAVIRRKAGLLDLSTQAPSVQERLQPSPAEFTQPIPPYVNSAKLAAPYFDFQSSPPVPPELTKPQVNANTSREILIRGSKRQFSEPDTSETPADKRTRIADHEEMDARPASTRGKKRNWETESDAGTEGTSRGAPELQKRRLDVRRPASLDYRGRKRDRSDTGSLIGDSDTPHSRKRGKIYDGSDDIELLDGIEEEGEGEGDLLYEDGAIFDSGGSYSDVDDDASMDDDDPLPFLTDPVIQGRAIGEEWEINKQRYRVGSNGKRERYVLVKGMENKFNMPRDSLHPDALTMIQIVSPQWLTDVEYHDARSRQELAWQDSTFLVGEATTSRTLRGKNLLWSASSPSNSPVKKAFQTSPVVTSANPLDSSRRSLNGRSTHAPLASASPSVAIGGKLRHSNSLSKWEKQDAEAVALARIRKPPQGITALPKAVGPVVLKAGPATPTQGDLKDTSVSVSTPAPMSKDDSGIVPHGNPSARPPAAPLTPPSALENISTAATPATPHSTNRVQKSQTVLPTLVGQRSPVLTGLSLGPSVSPMFFAKPSTLTTEPEKAVSTQSTREKSFTNGDLSKATLGQEELQSDAPLDKASEIPPSKLTSTDKRHLLDAKAPSTQSPSYGLIQPNPVTIFGESKSPSGLPFAKSASMDRSVAPKLPRRSDRPSNFAQPVSLNAQEPKPLELPHQSEVNGVASNLTSGTGPTSGGIFGRAIRGLPIKPNAVESSTAQNPAPSFKFGPPEVATKQSSSVSSHGTQHPFSFGTPPITVSGAPEKEPANPPLQFGLATNTATSNFTFGSASNQKTS